MGSGAADGSNVNGSFNFKLQVNTGIFYDLKGNVSDNGTTMTGSYSSNCSSDHGTFTGSLYAPVNKTYIGIVNGSNDDGTVTQYNATLVLTEDAQFNVTGSIQLNTPSGTATCYGTIKLSGPATGGFMGSAGRFRQCTDAWVARDCGPGGLQFGERADFGNRFAGLRQRSGRRHTFVGEVEEAQLTAPIRNRDSRRHVVYATARGLVDGARCERLVLRANGPGVGLKRVVVGKPAVHTNRRRSVKPREERQLLQMISESVPHP